LLNNNIFEKGASNIHSETSSHLYVVLLKASQIEKMSINAANNAGAEYKPSRTA
jgi:hypothetical protein